MYRCSLTAVVRQRNQLSHVTHQALGYNPYFHLCLLPDWIEAYYITHVLPVPSIIDAVIDDFGDSRGDKSLNPTQCFAQIVLCRLLQEVFELAGAGRMAELPQCLGLDLADTLPGHAELPPDFLQGAASPVLQAEAQL